MSLLEKGSVYEQPSVYNQGGGGGISVDGWGFVKIGGEDYGYIQLADKLITTRNLDFLPSGITIGTETTTSPRACYYNNDSIQAKKRGYGLMYNWAAVKYIIDNDLLPEGWGILTESVCDLIQHIFDPSYNVGEGKNTCRKHVDWASSNWNDYGDNRSHLSLMPCGRRQYGSWNGLGDYCRIWTSSTKKVFSLAVSPYSLWPGFDYVDDSEFTYIRIFKQMTELDLN